MIRALSLLCLWVLSVLVGCAVRPDPSLTGEAPASPAREWKGETIELPKKNCIPIIDITCTMSLSQLLDMALYNNPSTRVTWNAARAAAYTYRETLSAYYPTIAYTGTLSCNNNTIGASTGTGTTSIPNSSSIPGVTGSVASTAISAASPQVDTLSTLFTGSYLLLDFGGRDAETELALQTLYAANWQHNYTMQQVLLSVLTAYTSLLGNKALVAADRQDLKDAEVALDAAEKMKAAGLATQTDVLQAKSVVEQTKYNLEQAIGAEKTALADLIVAIGLPLETNLCVQDFPDKLPVVPVCGNLDSLLELAKTKRPDIGIAIAAVKEQFAAARVAFSAGMPTLNLTSSLNHVHFIHNSALDGHNNNLSLVWNVPIFNGFYYYNQDLQYKALIQESLANLDVQLSQVAIQVATNYYALLTAAASIPSAEAAVDYSHRAYKGYIAQYKTGTASILDVVTSLTMLSNARSQLVLTRTQWAFALANLAFAVGILDDTRPHWLTGCNL